MKTTRRSFLKTGVIAPIIIPSALWAAPTQPNDRITVGFIGMGIQARGLLNGFLYRSQVVAICDVDSTRREDGRQRVDDFYTSNPDNGAAGCKAYNNFEDLLARDDIDAVCIATPDHWHAAITLAALRSGKDVYCEKPLTHDIAEAVAVMKEVDLQGRVLQAGSMQRSSQEFRVACELARNGAIGRIKWIECSFGDPGVPCDLPGEAMEPGLDWNLWVGPGPMRPYNSILSPRGLHDYFPQWRNYMEYGGGQVADWGAHHLDIAQWALGMDESGPVKVLPPKDRNATRGARLFYKNGTQVIHKDGFGVDMVGTEGRIQVNRGRFCFMRGDETIAKFTNREDGGTLESKIAMVEREYLKDAAVHLYKVEGGHIDDFLNCVRSRKKPVAHEGVAARSAICCHLMNLAYYHGKPFKWDPAACTFSAGTGDAAWLEGSRRDYKKRV